MTRRTAYCSGTCRAQQMDLVFAYPTECRVRISIQICRGSSTGGRTVTNVAGLRPKSLRVARPAGITGNTSVVLAPVTVSAGAHVPSQCLNRFPVKVGRSLGQPAAWVNSDRLRCSRQVLFQIAAADEQAGERAGKDQICVCLHRKSQFTSDSSRRTLRP